VKYKDHHQVQRTATFQQPHSFLLNIIFLFTLMIGLCAPLLLWAQGDPAPTGLDDKATEKSESILLNPPSLHAPYIYTPKVYPAHQIPVVNVPLEKKAISTEPLNVELDLPSYLHDVLVIRWNSHMISPLQVGSSPKLDVKITPAIKGKWRWQGTRSIIFQTATRWRKSTRYEVTLKGPMQAVSGQKIGPYFKVTSQFSTDHNEVNYVELNQIKTNGKDEYLTWNKYLSHQSFIKVCFDQQTKGQPPLSIFSLRKIEGKNLGQALSLAYASNQKMFKKNDKRCSGLKVVDPIAPFAKYSFKVGAGITSKEGPLVSAKPYYREYMSHPRLKINHVKINQHVASIRFNLPLSEESLYENIRAYPPGINPNQLTPAAQKTQNLIMSYKSQKKATDRVRSYQYLAHRIDPRSKAALWVRPTQIQTTPNNTLQREQVAKFTKVADHGQEWMFLKEERPDLGHIMYDMMPSTMSVEQLNHPSQKLSFYGMDHLCMQWYQISPEALAKHDLMSILNSKKMNALSFPTTDEELCINLFNPKYVHHNWSFPVVPYRYAVGGESKDWSFGTSPSSTTSAIARPPLATTQKVVDHCQAPDGPCQVKPSSWSSYYDWANQRPSIKSGSGAHFYILRQKWHWTPKPEDISTSYYRGKKSVKGDYHYVHQSLLQATRYGLVAKLNEVGGQVWVWDLFTKRSAAQANIRVYANDGTLVSQSKSNPQGIAQINFDPQQIAQIKARKLAAKTNTSLSYYVVADVKGDYAFVSSHNEHQVNYYYGDYFYRQNNDQKGQLWSDRGIYRPGDSLFIGGVFAQVTSKGVEPLRQQKCTLNLINNKGVTEESKVLTTTTLGSVKVVFKLAKKAELGFYHVTAQCDVAQAKNYKWRHEFRVAHFRRPTFKVDAYAKESDTFTDQPSLQSVQANYLYGATMTNKSWQLYIDGRRQAYSPSKTLKYQRAEDPPNTRLGTVKLSEFNFGAAQHFQHGDTEINSAFNTLFPHFKAFQHIDIGSSFHSGKLDHNGQASITVTPKINDYTPYRLTSTWMVTDSDAQAMSATNVTTVHPTSRYIGLKSLSGSYAPSNRPLSVEALWLNPLTDSFASPQSLEVTLLQVKWVKIAIIDEIGRDQVENQRRLVKVGSCRLEQVSTPQTCTLKPTGSGEHFWVAHGSDEQGRKTYSIINTYLYGTAGSWRENQGHYVDLKLTTATPKIGDLLGVLIENPFKEAEAWITVERDRIIYSQRKYIGAAEMIQIPITEEMGPNAWVKVVLTRPRTTLPYLKKVNDKKDQNSPSTLEQDSKNDDSNDHLGQPKELYGEQQIHVKLIPAELSVTLTPDQKEKRPGDILNVNLSLQDVKGQPASGEVFLWALDEGVARLTGYQPPNLLESIHSDRYNQVDTYSHLKRLIEHQTMGNKGYPVGGGGDEEEGSPTPNPRSDFKATPFFVGATKVGPSGQAVISQKLSDDLTTFKLFAVAISERPKPKQQPISGESAYLLRVGNGTSKVIVNLPLMIRPTLPRTLTVGDRFNAGAMVSSLLKQDQDLTVKFELSGPIEALGNTEKSLTVPAQNNRVTHVPYLVTGLGTVKVKLTLYRDKRIEDITIVDLEVKPPSAPEHFAQVGDLVAKPNGQNLTIDLRPAPQPKTDSTEKGVSTPAIPADLRLDFGVSVVNSLLGEVVGLLEYPYGCLEQRSSRILPFALAPTLRLPLKRYLKDQLQEVTPTFIKSTIQDYYKTVGQMQNSSGGIRYWPNHSARIHVWANVYAFMVINELQKIGYSSELVNVTKLAKFLKKSRPHQNTLKRGEYRVNPDTSAFLAFVLSEYSTPQYALEEELVAQLDQLNLTAKLLLSASMAGKIDQRSQGARMEQAKQVFAEAMKSFRFDGERLQLDQDKNWAWWSFDSERRKLALALIAILRVDPKSDLVLPILRTLTQKIEGQQRLNTQATAFVLLAIRDYIKVKESTPPDMHVDVQMLTLNQGQRDKQVLSTHDIKGVDSPLINIKRSINLLDDSATLPAYPVVEGLSIKASGQGRLYYGTRITRYPQTVRQESLNRGYGLERKYTLQVPSNATEAQLKKLFNPNLSNTAKSALLPQTLSYQVGDLITVELTLNVPHTSRYLVINDALPSGLEIVDPSLKGAQVKVPKNSKQSPWYIFDHIELRDDRVLLFADRLSAGTYQFSYLTRATTAGRFIRPAAVVEEMYDPQHAGRTDGGHLWIRPAN
jgi:alpha-2-macroglobulin